MYRKPSGEFGGYTCGLLEIMLTLLILLKHLGRGLASRERT